MLPGLISRFKATEEGAVLAMSFTKHMKSFRHTFHSPQLPALQGKAERSDILHRLALPPTMFCTEFLPFLEAPSFSQVSLPHPASDLPASSVQLLLAVKGCVWSCSSCRLEFLQDSKCLNGFIFNTLPFSRKKKCKPFEKTYVKSSFFNSLESSR